MKDITDDLIRLGNEGFPIALKAAEEISRYRAALGSADLKAARIEAENDRLRARLAEMENLHDEYNMLTATYMSLQNQYYDAQKRLAEIEGQARPFYDVDPNWLYSVIRYARKTWFEVDVAEGLREMEEDEAFMLPNLYAAPVPAIPEGWKLVPVRPTDKMFFSGDAEQDEDMDAAAIYRAMLAAAPQPEGGSK